MPTATYEKIATTTGSDSSKSITFSSIPSTYTDLRVVCVIKLPSGSGGINVQFNGDTAGNYSKTQLTGDGSSAISTRVNNASAIVPTYTGVSTTPSMITIDVMSYTGSTNKTSLFTFSSGSGGSVSYTVGLWRNTSAINSITINQDDNFLGTSSTFTLYGILKA